MTTVPTFPILKLLTDEEIERGLAEPYTLQPDDNGVPRLRNTGIKDTWMGRSMGLCFIGAAIGMSCSPSPSMAARAYPLRGRDGLTEDELIDLLLPFMHAIDQKGEVLISDDATLRAVIAASREA